MTRQLRGLIVLVSLMAFCRMATPAFAQFGGTPIPHPDLWFPAYSGVPVGTIVQFAGPAVPDGWLLCDGSLVSRAEYPRLYEAYEFTYGSSADWTSFGLPNCSGRTLVSTGTSDGVVLRLVGESYGENSHQLTINEMPVHQHGMNNYQLLRRCSSCGNVSNPGGGDGASWWNAASQFAGGDQPFPVSQPSLVTYFIIWSGEGLAAMDGEGGGGVQPTPGPEVVVYSTVASGEVTQAVGFAYTIDAGQIGIMVLLFAILVVLMLRAVTDLIGWRRGN